MYKAESAPDDAVDRVIHYHERTKHHYHRYARSLGFLDWANQPDPFRRFAGADLILLPLLGADEEPSSPSYAAIYEPGAVASRPITKRTLSRFFEYALALSAWKKAGQSEWALRSNPSSGNLHPTEGYVVLPVIEGLDLEPGLYHYAPREHGLEWRASFPADLVKALFAPFPAGSFLLGFTSVHWREAWKYGERAFRYCNHDVGHALGTARVAAATLGWRMMVLDGTDQHTVASLLGTDRDGDFAGAELEHPACLSVIWPVDAEQSNGESGGGTSVPVAVPGALDPAIVRRLADSRWYGKANRLSPDHAADWDIIDATATASWKNQAESWVVCLPACQINRSTMKIETSPLAGQIIRQRRSAVAYDGKTSIAASVFFRILQRIMPRADCSQLDRPMPWDVWPYEPAIHLLLFVHRIDGLTPGIYFLVRDETKLPFICESTNPELNWVSAPGCPDDLPLFWLLEGDARQLAAQVSCHQDIAGDSAFSCGMLAEFEGRLRRYGAWMYPRLFWEAGLLGQVLYLEAEAAGVRGTGIGCFFDDPVHQIIAVQGLRLQSLYHFTIGGPVEDRRLMTLPPYGHLLRAERKAGPVQDQEKTRGI